MIKISVFIGAIFILIQNGSSSEDQFGSFFGPCPAAPTNSRSRISLHYLAGKWYTHRVLGQYSPWKYFECQTNNIVSDSESETTNVTTKFDIPSGRLAVEWNGLVQAVSKKIGKFEFDYILDGWSLSQNIVFLRYYPGAALVWNCFDFLFFHIESIAVMTKYQDPNDHRISPRVFNNFNNTLTQSGISPHWFEPIEQRKCRPE